VGRRREEGGGEVQPRKVCGPTAPARYTPAAANMLSGFNASDRLLRKNHGDPLGRVCEVALPAWPSFRPCKSSVALF